MRSRKTFIGLLLIVAVLLLGIGYAVISNVELNITGTTSATASDANFKVKFDSTVTPTTSNATASITGDKTATIAVSGLTTKGDKATATYTVINESADLGAALSASVTKNTNSDFFTVTHEFEKTTLAAGGTTTVTVTVELIKTPATDQSGEVGVELIAQPVQDVDASEPVLISFTIDGTTYQAEEGMTWTEFLDSEYNITDFEYFSGADGDYLRVLKAGNIPYRVRLDGSEVRGTDFIVSRYVLYYEQSWYRRTSIAFRLLIF